MANIIIGGFFGDEGKGKIVGTTAVVENYDLVVKAGGGPQAGHTVTDGLYVTQIPSGFVNPKARLLIGRGTVINPEVVLSEIEKYKVHDRIGIDYGCTVIEPHHIEEEQELVKRVGSVGTGTGPARVARIMRTAKLAKDIEALKPYLTDVAEEIHKAHLENKKVMIEGVQGFGLSLLDHNYYPNVTSQDTTASQFAVDAGVGPKAIDEIIIIYKAYISRVGKGDLDTEWNAEQEKNIGIEERGTVSGRKRRLGNFDKSLAKKSLIRNSATHVAITCIDRLFPGNDGVTNFHNLTQEAQKFIKDLHQFFKANSPYYKEIAFVSTGPNLNDIINTRGIL